MLTVCNRLKTPYFCGVEVFSGTALSSCERLLTLQPVLYSSESICKFQDRTLACGLQSTPGSVINRIERREGGNFLRNSTFQGHLRSFKGTAQYGVPVRSGASAMKVLRSHACLPSIRCLDRCCSLGASLIAPVIHRSHRLLPDLTRRLAA